MKSYLTALFFTRRLSLLIISRHLCDLQGPETLRAALQQGQQYQQQQLLHSMAFCRAVFSAVLLPVRAKKSTGINGQVTNPYVILKSATREGLLIRSNLSQAWLLLSAGSKRRRGKKIPLIQSERRPTVECRIMET